MLIKQCKMCGKPFQALGGNICSQCLENIERDYITVRDYLYEHGKERVDANRLSEETGVSKAVILHLIQENRIYSRNLAEVATSCRMCGAPIDRGSICAACSDRLTGRDKQPRESKIKIAYSEREDGRVHVTFDR